MLKVSLVMLADKLGGFDIFATGILQQTFKDFEIIVVDELYKKRSDKVIPFLEKLGVTQPLTHIPIHLRAHHYPCSLAAAYNTGIVHARGDIIITMCQYMILPPQYIELHIKYQDKFKRKACISGIKCQFRGPLHYTDGFKLHNPKGILRTWKEDFKFNLNDYVLYGFEPSYKEYYKVELEDLTHPPPAVGNDMMSYPLEAWLDVNGYYERLDEYFEFMAWETTVRMMLAGYDVYVIGEIEGYHMYHAPRETRTPEGKGRGYFGPEILARMNKLLNNELSYVAPNPYNLREKRAEILGLKENGAI